MVMGCGNTVGGSGGWSTVIAHLTSQRVATPVKLWYHPKTDTLRIMGLYMFRLLGQEFEPQWLLVKLKHLFSTLIIEKVFKDF